MISKEDARYIADTIFEVGERRCNAYGYRDWYSCAINFYIDLTEGYEDLDGALQWLKDWNEELHGDDTLNDLIEYLEEEYYVSEDEPDDSDNL